jgi:chemotaxis protein MotA
MRFYLSVIMLLLTLSIGMLFGGISIGVVFNLSEWFLITGIAVSSFMLSNPNSLLKKLFKELPKVILERPYKKEDYMDLLQFLFFFFRYSNSVNISEIENDIDNPDSSQIFAKYPILLQNKNALSFFQNHFRFLTLGFQDVNEIGERMEVDLDFRRREVNKLNQSLNKLGDSLPALGIVAAVLGVIGAMSSAGAAPEILGARVAGALIGTFAGVFFAYCVVNPINSFLDKFQNEELDFIDCMKITMLAYMKGYPISIAIEFGRQAIAPDLQPSFAEVEDLIYNKKTSSN